MSNIENESRAQFEEFFKANVAQLVRCGAIEQAKFIETQREMWMMVWEASRETLVISLPKSRGDNGERANGDQSLLSALMANQLAIDECRAAIESQGVKCK